MDENIENSSPRTRNARHKVQPLTKEHEEEIHELEATVGNLEEQNSLLRQKRDKFKAQLGKKEEELESRSAEVTAALTRVDQLAAEVKQLKEAGGAGLQAADQEASLQITARDATIYALQTENQQLRIECQEAQAYSSGVTSRLQKMEELQRLLEKVSDRQGEVAEALEQAGMKQQRGHHGREVSEGVEPTEAKAGQEQSGDGNGSAFTAKELAEMIVAGAEESANNSAALSLERALTETLRESVARLEQELARLQEFGGQEQWSNNRAEAEDAAATNSTAASADQQLELAEHKELLERQGLELEQLKAKLKEEESARRELEVTVQLSEMALAGMGSAATSGGGEADAPQRVQDTAAEAEADEASKALKEQVDMLSQDLAEAKAACEVKQQEIAALKEQLLALEAEREGNAKQHAVVREAWGQERAAMEEELSLIRGNESDAESQMLLMKEELERYQAGEGASSTKVQQLELQLSEDKAAREGMQKDHEAQVTAQTRRLEELTAALAAQEASSREQSDNATRELESITSQLEAQQARQESLVRAHEEHVEGLVAQLAAAKSQQSEHLGSQEGYAKEASALRLQLSAAQADHDDAVKRSAAEAEHLKAEYEQVLKKHSKEHLDDLEQLRADSVATAKVHAKEVEQLRNSLARVEEQLGEREALYTHQLVEMQAQQEELRRVEREKMERKVGAAQDSAAEVEGLRRNLASCQQLLTDSKRDRDALERERKVLEQRSSNLTKQLEAQATKGVRAGGSARAPASASMTSDQLLGELLAAASTRDRTDELTAQLQMLRAEKEVLQQELRLEGRGQGSGDQPSLMDLQAKVKALSAQLRCEQEASKRVKAGEMQLRKFVVHLHAKLPAMSS